MTDISTKAIIERCDHIDHCSLNTHHQDALRMRALVAERDTLAKTLEREKADHRTALRRHGGKMRAMQQKLDQMQLVCVEVGQLARNTALVEAAEKIAGQNHVDSELRRGRLQAPGVLTRAFETILSLRSGPLNDCPECRGSGMRDSGGVQPWGDHIDVPCDCGNAPRPKSKAVPSTASVEVCGICDIAGCHHTRELNEKMPNEIAAWPTFPDGCVTGSWSANQHRQDAVAYVRKELAPRHPDDAAVDRFAAAMKAKLAAKRADGRGGWGDKAQCSQQFLSDLLRGHVDKGDPVDVANFAMMLHQRGEAIASTPAAFGFFEDKYPQAVLPSEARSEVLEPLTVEQLVKILNKLSGELSAAEPAPCSGDMSSQGMPITFTYTNWRGETAQRTAVPKRIWFGSTDWHPEPGWLMTAHDLEKAADRDFALADCAFADAAEEEQDS